MTTIQLKNTLIQRISEIQDVAFLEALKTILDSKRDSQIMKLTPEIINEIIESKKEIKAGLFFDNDQIEKETEEWLSKK
jgi:hypothetical protein